MDIVKGAQLLAALVAKREPDAQDPAPVPEGMLPVFGWARAKRPGESGPSGIAETWGDDKISP